MRSKEEMKNEINNMLNDEKIFDALNFNLSNSGDKTDEGKWSDSMKKVYENNKSIIGVL